MHLLKDIVTFAWRGPGKFVLITCVVLSVVADLASLAPLVGAVAVLLLSGYFSAIYYQLIQSSATGDKEAPEFPEISNLLEDVIWPFLQIIAVMIISFGPFLAYSFAAEDPRLVLGLSLLGLVYFPMAMLAVVVLGHLGAASPHIVFPAIFRGGWIYWIGIALIVVLYVAKWLVADLLSGHLIVGNLVMAVAGSYVLMTNARILGIVYRERQEQLGWL